MKGATLKQMAIENYLKAIEEFKAALAGIKEEGGKTRYIAACLVLHASKRGVPRSMLKLSKGLV